MNCFFFVICIVIILTVSVHSVISISEICLKFYLPMLSSFLESKFTFRSDLFAKF